MARHHGKNGALLMSETASGGLVKVASLDAWDLDMSMPGVDVSSFGDANDREVKGRPRVAGTFGGNWDDAVKTPWRGRKSTTGVFLYLYPDEVAAPGMYAYGPAWIDMRIGTSASGKVAINGAFSANGDWGDTFGV